MFDYRAAVYQVTDGDTIVLTLDQGLGDRSEEPIRLIGVRAPERGEVGWLEARMFTVEWCERLSRATRWPLYVRTLPNTSFDPTEKRSFVRWLGEVYEVMLPLRINPATNWPYLARNLNVEVQAFLDLHPEWGPGQ
jgi:hypothetical protein